MMYLHYLARLSACVTDGVTVGHPCCGYHDCQIPLASQRDRFCPQHVSLTFQCAVRDCINPSTGAWRTCDILSHRAFEERKREEGRAVFRLRAKLARSSGEAARAPPDDEADYLDELDPEDEAQPVGDPTSTPDIPPTTSHSGPKLHARLTRRWTHNEQLMVRCCGIILSRATFFGSEGITSVKVRGISSQ